MTMTKNVGTLDRVFRGLGAASMLTCAFMAPLPLEVRVPVFGSLGAYLLFSSLKGTCLGYRLLGKNTCAASPR